MAFLCLLGIGALLWVYVTQNNLVAEAFGELVLQESMERPFTPADLGDLAHEVCVLDSGISNVQSFLQPIGTTLSEGGWCGNYVRVFISFAHEAGYPAHKFHIQSGGRSHTLAEVYYEGKWRIIDPFFNQIYQLPNGEMATYQDLRQNLALLDSPTKRPADDPRLDRIFGNYVPIFPVLYRDAPDFYPKLNRSGLYHNAFVVLSYPLALFYEGGRRPILPSWLDRPELLGVYFLTLVLLIAVVPLAIRFRNKSHRRD
ncbi:MAG: transglutaminase domain-containing protein [Chloroflexi bacterium]|nr:transglutaminase domain-containing protein [Chloroflexota bacterium]MDA1219529.1 transglutaminase domain-containing protein [Chloroflexota bacterium]